MIIEGKVMRICMHLDGDITADDLGQKTVHLTNLDRRVGWIAMKGECDLKMKFRNKESKQCAVGVEIMWLCLECEIALVWMWLFH